MGGDFLTALFMFFLLNTIIPSKGTNWQGHKKDRRFGPFRDVDRFLGEERAGDGGIEGTSGGLVGAAVR